jgi:hypothetical protein
MNSVYLNDNEYSPFYKNYIKALGEVNLFEVLENSIEELVKTVKDLPEEKLEYRYTEGKWTIKELIQHLIDTERILGYRALRFSRNDVTEIHGFNENWFVTNSNGNERTINELLNELTTIRKSSVLLFKSFTNEMFSISGIANGNEMTVRALGFIIPGHLIHHTNIIKERYL